MAVGKDFFPKMYPVPGFRLGVSSAGIKKSGKKDLVVMELADLVFEELVEEFIKIIVSYKGVIKKRENWGVRNLAYKIKV